MLSRRVWDNAGSPEVDTRRLMVSIGTGLGSSEELVFAYDDMRAKGMRAVSPLAVQKYMPNWPAAAVGLERQAKAGVITRSRPALQVRRALFTRGATLCSARPTSRSAVA